jgi:hypothetical protein
MVSKRVPQKNSKILKQMPHQLVKVNQGMRAMMMTRSTLMETRLPHLQVQRGPVVEDVVEQEPKRANTNT